MTKQVSIRHVGARCGVLSIQIPKGERDQAGLLGMKVSFDMRKEGDCFGAGVCGYVWVEAPLDVKHPLVGMCHGVRGHLIHPS